MRVSINIALFAKIPSINVNYSLVRKKYNTTYPLRLEKLYGHLSKIPIPEELRGMYVLILRKIAGKARPTPLEKVGLEIVHNEIENLIINLNLEKL